MTMLHSKRGYCEMFRFETGMLPKTEYVGEHEVTMPLHPLMNEDDIEYIILLITLER